MTWKDPAVSRVPDAFSTLDEDRYTRHPNGTLVTQSTSAKAIARELQALDIPDGARVLELGTGSGFSSRWIAELAGSDGHVVTLDVVPELTARAIDLFQEDGLGDRISALTRDGLEGAPEHGPYDRIVAWATPGWLPKTWVEQAKPGAVIVTPVDVAPLARIARGIVRITITQEGLPQAEAVYSGGYVDMHDQVLTQWLLPTRHVDAHAEAHGKVWWASSPVLRTADHPARQQALALLQTADPGALGPDPLAETEDWSDLLAWLFATLPTGLATAGIQDPRPWIGVLTPTGLALLTPGGLLRAGDQQAHATLSAWLDQWRTAGRPGWGQVRPSLTSCERGWEIRLTTDNAVSAATGPRREEHG